MAYTAYRTKAPIQPSQLEKIQLAKAEYAKKVLLPSGKTIPDPLQIQDGWQGEKEAMFKWPNVTHGDIILYLKGKIGIDANDTLNAYKEGKAFSYFESKFVKEIFFKELAHDLCLVKTLVTPSQCINQPPHQVWACMKLPEGDILSAYCNCTAG